MFRHVPEWSVFLVLSTPHIHVTFVGKASSDFGVKQILHRVDVALYIHPKNSLRSHLRAIMALDHS